jgi:hypothetical protein
MDRKTALWYMNRMFDACISVKKNNESFVSQINLARQYIKENLK